MNHMGTRVDKGKRRAVEDLEEPNESTPLLGSSGQHSELISLEVAPMDHWDIDWTAIVRTLLYGLFLALIVLLGLLAYAVSELRRDVTLDRVQWNLKDLRVLNVTNGDGDDPASITAEVEFLVGGLDLSRLPGWEQKLVSWGIQTLDTIRVTTSPTSGLVSTPSGVEDIISVTVDAFEFKLPRNAGDKQPITVRTQIRPKSTPDRILDIIQYTWAMQEVRAFAVVHDIHIEGTYGWRKLISKRMDVFRVPLYYELPVLPFLPPPPTPLIPALVSTIKLTHLQVNSNHTVDAVATIPNPLPYFSLPPFSFSLTPSIKGLASLPPFNSSEDSPTGSAPALPMVEATAREINITSSSKELTIPLHGDILPIPSTAAASQQMSRFLSTYLSGYPSPVLVSLPKFNLSLPYDFPPPHPKPKILEDVQLSNLKITLHGLEAFVNGQIDVQIAFPKGINLDVIVHRVSVDVIAYDGPVPDTSSFNSSRLTEEQIPTTFLFPFPKIPIKLPFPIPRVELPWPWKNHYKARQSPPPHPLPSPLPPNAFARIRPEEWLNSTSVSVIHKSTEKVGADVDDHEVGTRLKVHAEFRDVSVKILPDRDSVFRTFLRKFLFSEETLAGVQGFAGVGVIIPGLLEGNGAKGDLELLDLPFDGSVYVGKGDF